MKTRFALLVFATLSLLSVSVAHATDAPTVAISAPGSAVAGHEGVFTVTASGDGATALNLDYRIEGGEIAGVISLNQTSPGVASAAVHVYRATPGDVTLTAFLGDEQVARATMSFVAGAQISVELTLDADAGAAARTFYFEVLSATGIRNDVIHVGTSGDAPRGVATSVPLADGAYVVRPALGHDVAAACENGAFYAITPAEGQALMLPGSLSAAFTVRPCAALPTGYGVDAPYDPYTPPAGDVIDEVAGVRVGIAPLPPATGNGQANGKPEPWVLSDTHARQLFGLLLSVVLALVIGTAITRLLAHIAPVRKPAKK